MKYSGGILNYLDENRTTCIEKTPEEWDAGAKEFLDELSKTVQRFNIRCVTVFSDILSHIVIFVNFRGVPIAYCSQKAFSSILALHSTETPPLDSTGEEQ